MFAFLLQQDVCSWEVREDKYIFSTAIVYTLHTFLHAKLNVCHAFMILNLQTDQHIKLITGVPHFTWLNGCGGLNLGWETKQVEINAL